MVVIIVFLLLFLVSLIETILCYLELKPYKLISQEGTHFDHIQGNFKTNFHSEFEFDALLRTISKVNQIKSSDCENETGRNSFEVSLLTLSLDLQLPPEIIFSKLYNLQKREILVYNISQKSLYVKISDSVYENIVDSFEQWIWKLSQQLTEHLSQKFETLANRVVDIWKFGHLLTNISDPLHDILGNEGGNQEVAREFLSSYMMSGHITHEESELSSKLSSCPLPFIHSSITSNPSSTSSSSSSSNVNSHNSCLTEEKKLQHLQKCQQHINILTIDPFLDEVLDKMILQHVKQTFSPIKLPQLRKELKAVMIAKILHGHQSSLIQLSDWGHRAQWGACKIISFSTIVSLCLNENRI